MCMQHYNCICVTAVRSRQTHHTRKQKKEELVETMTRIRTVRLGINVFFFVFLFFLLLFEIG